MDDEAAKLEQTAAAVQQIWGALYELADPVLIATVLELVTVAFFKAASTNPEGSADFFHQRLREHLAGSNVTTH